jgi:hypothetical protein
MKERDALQKLVTTLDQTLNQLSARLPAPAQTVANPTESVMAKR